MHKIGLLVMALLVWFVVAGAAFAQNLQPLTEQEQVRTGATHVWRVTTDDLTTTTADTAQALNFAVPAGTAVEFVSYRMVTAFNAAATNDSLTISIGDEDSATRFLAATQIASDDTEVYVAWPSTSLTYAAAHDATNNTTTVLSTVARYYYSAAKSLRLTFTPANGGDVADYTTGDIRVYWRIVRE
jgi:hypothetical protein